MDVKRLPREKRFMLRRTLFPWKFEETIEEAVRFAAEFGVDEVVWKIDTEEFSHGLPTLERIRTYLPWLERSREALARVGASMSINPWVTQGMRDAGLDNRAEHPDFEWMTDISGAQAKSIACPLGEAWRRWLRDAYVLYASTGPRVLWIEDDIRVHGHRPLKWGCFCELHLRAFGERVGRRFTREELAAEVLRPGDPSPLRAEWVDFEGEGIEESVRRVAEAVYRQHPHVRLGLMTSAPWMHAMEQRHWDRLMEILAGPHETVTVRPCMGNYQEQGPRGIYDSWHLVAGTLACIRRPVHACTEVENWPFTRFSKSLRFTRAQLLLSAALRCPSMTLNLYDHVGTPLYAEPEYGRMLKATRPFLDSLVQAYQPDGVERGLGVLHPEDGGKHKRLKDGAGYGDLSMSREGWANPLQALGMAATMAESPVRAISGQRLEAYAGELEKIFSGGVLLDLSGYETLARMGAGEVAGARLRETYMRGERATPAEEALEDFGGTGGTYMTVDHLGLAVRVGCFDPAQGARVISRLVDPDRRPVQPGFLLFENRLGGRVALCPYDITQSGMSAWFLNWHRQRQMQRIAEWLFRGRAPLLANGGAWGLPIRTDYPDGILVSLLNLSCDPWEQTTLTLCDVAGRASAECLGRDGIWQRLPTEAVQRQGDRLTLTLAQGPDFLDMLAIRIR